MRRLRGWPVALGVILGVLAISAYRQIASFDTEKITDDLHVIYGVGGPWMASGNVAVLKTSAGPVVVDTMTFPFYGRWIQDFAGQVAGGHKPVMTRTDDDCVVLRGLIDNRRHGIVLRVAARR